MVEGAVVLGTVVVSWLSFVTVVPELSEKKNEVFKISKDTGADFVLS